MQYLQPVYVFTTIIKNFARELVIYSEYLKIPSKKNYLIIYQIYMLRKIFRHHIIK